MKLTIFFAIVVQVSACQIVEFDRLTAKDLASANAAFAVLDPDLEIAPAPLAGVARVMRAAELSAIARRNGLPVSVNFTDVCFERATQQLSAEQLAPVLEAALPGAAIEILDYSRFAVPRGRLEFTRAGLTAAGLWRGRVGYAEGRSAAVWAKVRVTVAQTWIESTVGLASGKPIEASQLVIRTGARFPFAAPPLDSIEQAAGREPIRAIAPGQPLYAAMLQAPREIERGDKVSVEVASGAAFVAFDAIAGAPGRRGESIIVRNPQNGRYFRARIEGKGKVSVRP